MQHVAGSNVPALKHKNANITQLRWVANGMVSALTIDFQGDVAVHDSNSNVIQRTGKVAIVSSLGCKGNATLIHIIRHFTGSFY